MNIKVKLVDKKTQAEISDILIMNALQQEIEDMIKRKYPNYNSVIKLYGEIVPMRR